MRGRLPWFRMYTDFLNDPKMIALAFEDQRHFIGVLALKCDGAIDDVADGDLLDRIVAQRLWIDHAIIRDVKKRLVEAGLITADWQPVAWERRQFKSDSSKERVARFRARKKQQAEGGNAEVTLPKRPSNAIDTETETETETEEGIPPKPPKPQKRGKSSALEKPASVTDPVWLDFVSLRKAKRAPLTATALAGIEREASKAGVSLQVALETCCANGWQGFRADWYAPHTKASRPQSVKNAAAAKAIFGSDHEVIDV